ncbi:MAG: type II toxin-antitoxin system VapC family toxin [Ignavibacteriaceae bacterium]
MTTSDLILLDTNVLVYAADVTSPFHNTANLLLDRGLQNTISLCITPQVLFEFFSVITNPKRVDTAWDKEKAVRAMEKYYYANQIKKIYPNTNDIKELLDFLKRYEIKGRGIFDLHLVVTMLSNGVTRICTYNEKDFLKYSEIEVLNPKSVIK